jgi:hypothetical protein
MHTVIDLAAATLLFVVLRGRVPAAQPIPQQLTPHPTQMA